MAALRSASFFSICFLLCSSEAQEKITAEPGQDVILTCKAPDNNNIHINNIRAVEWSRPGRNTEYVLVYRDGRFDPHNQHPSYQNRVDLQDKEMKDGDFSLILKDVMKNDTGTYECWVFQKGTNRRKRWSSEPINVITLAVHPSGEKSEGAKGGIIGDEGKEIGRDQVGISSKHLGVVGVILLAVLASVGFLIYRRHMRQNPNLPVPPDEAAADQIL
ncbi:uncharacterized protein LOC127532617 [Acanthochromis polyacanthus]|uniref:uncharacterized protein LOC127532617 n=1 Tax=Acanthochromis polyacanthus TaxID=80966 RepID=UPI0022346232|nr:uncharacterized protein LOC127532617 [Acanthochromis polyacanthus]